MKPISISILFTALLATACSSSSSPEEQQTITPTGSPMRFSTPSVGNMETRGATRASHSLASDFLVSVYKSYKTSAQQTVMSQYQARYTASGWSGTGANWNTVGITTDGFYQEQTEKYWDTAAFPYGFLAIAPAPVSGTSVADGFAVDDKQIKVKCAWQSQSAADGAITPSAPSPEYVVAQLTRRGNASDATHTDDVDLITGSTIGNGNDSPTKSVPLPFHHLSSKVRFGIYSTEPVSESQSIKIKNVSFTVTSAESDGFVTSAGSYAVNLTSVGNALGGSFGDKTFSATEKTLLTFTGPKDSDSDAFLEKHEWKSADDVNAYYFECKDGLVQVPQGKVKLSVSLTLEPKVGKTVTYTSCPLKITDSNGNSVEEFTWKPNTLYTYYIVVNQLFSHDISFTATVAPWEDVEGKIHTNLEE